MNKIRLFFVCLLSIISALSVDAKLLSVNEAIDYANRTSVMQFKQSHMMSPMSINSRSNVTYKLKHTLKTNGKPMVYVVSKSNGGFMLLSANDDVANGLIGYVDSGDFDIDSIPESFQYFLDATVEAVYYADIFEDKQAQDYEYQKKPAIAPIMVTKWGYSSPFNRYSPIVEDAKTPPGCVAIAMAQIMNVYRYPDCGVGTVSYTSTKKQKYEYDFSEWPINWSVVNPNISKPVEEAEQDVVARLMYTCGMSVKMNYASTGSSSSITKTYDAFINKFNYSKKIKSIKRAWFTNEEWENIVYDEIYNGRPIFYTGYSDKSGGHAFVCDGYNNGYFHINWGWGGYCDGYFLLSTLDAYQNSMGFCKNEEILLNVQPPMSDDEIFEPVMYTSNDVAITFDGETDNFKLPKNKGMHFLNIKASNGLWNGSTFAIDSCVFGLKMTNVDNGVVEHVSSLNWRARLAKGAAITSYSIQNTQFKHITDGTWIMQPALFQKSDSTWYDVYTPKTKEWAYVTEIKNDSMYCYAQSTAIANDIVDVTQIIDMIIPSTTSYITPMDVEITVKNKTQYATSKIYTPVLLSGDSIISRGTAQFLDLESGETEKVVWKSYWENDMSPGKYQVALMDKKGKLSQNRVDIDVEDLGNMSTAAAKMIIYDISSVHYVEIYDMSGMLVAKGEKLKRNLKPGIYIIQYYLSNGTKEIRKMYIE